MRAARAPMHAFKLCTLLESFFWWELHDLARQLDLEDAGGRHAITERVMELYADPVMSTRVAAVVRRAKASRPEGSKRRKVHDKHSGVADLGPLFDAVAEAPGSESSAASDACLLLDAVPIGPVMVVGQPGEDDVERAARETGKLVYFPRSMCIDRE